MKQLMYEWLHQLMCTELQFSYEKADVGIVAPINVHLITIFS